MYLNNEFLVYKKDATSEELKGVVDLSQGLAVSVHVCLVTVSEVTLFRVISLFYVIFIACS